MAKTKFEIISMTIIGNACDDQPIFQAVHEFTIDESNSWLDRADVQEWMEGEVMGCPSTRAEAKSDEEYVRIYLRECEDAQESTANN